MSVYQEQFKKYEDLSRQSYVNYFALINAVRNVMVEKPDEVKANAIVMFGFSGNGKSTWIQEFIKSNPNYVVLSMDEVVNDLFNKYQRMVHSNEVVEEFGNRLENICRNGNNVIIDGNFLNLLTRSALADTLKIFNYQVNLVDITENVAEYLKNRIIDVVRERYGDKYNVQNYNAYVHDRGYEYVQTEILEYYEKEKKTSNLDEQITYDVIDLGVNNVFNRNTPYEEIIRIPQSHK